MDEAWRAKRIDELNQIILSTDKVIFELRSQKLQTNSPLELNGIEANILRLRNYVKEYEEELERLTKTTEQAESTEREPESKMLEILTHFNSLIIEYRLLLVEFRRLLQESERKPQA